MTNNGRALSFPSVKRREFLSVEGIFHPFTRLEAARDRASGGAGIGLAITARAVQLHRGSVRAANAEGGGLVVAMTLPLA